MKKIFLLLSLSLILVGCQKSNNSSVLPTSSPQTQETKKDIITTIKDAVQNQMVLKCEYVDEDGDKTMTYIKGQTVRMIGQGGDDKKVEGLMKDGKFYIWSTENKEGMVLDISKFEGASMGNTPIHSIDDVIGVLESQKDKCVISPESLGLLDLPSDIKFTDSGSFFGGTEE